MRPEQDGADNLHAIGVLTRSTAHDVNNHMAAIMSFAELVLDAMPAGHPLRQELHSILSASHRVVTKTRELDKLARKLAPIGQS
jgi:two-component system, cell cycle sensor histidine kinase and response regulator CckA